MAEEEFSAEAFANEPASEEEDFPTGCPLSHKKIEFRQKKDRALQNKFRTQPESHVKKPHAFSDGECKLITKNLHSQSFTTQVCRMASLDVNASL